MASVVRTERRPTAAALRQCVSIPEQEAWACVDRLEESLRFIDRGLQEVRPRTDLGRLLVSGGNLNGVPVL